MTSINTRNKIFSIHIFVLTIGTLFFGCAQQSDTPSTVSHTQSIHTAFAQKFDIGVAVNRNQANGTDQESSAIARQHFNSTTAENDMKWESIQLVEGQFSFTHADALVEFAKNNNQNLIGHVLVWHEQTPDWVFEDEHGGPASRELLIQRMQTHISALAGRYKNDIQGWDVVNEALNEDGTMRDSKWRKIIGDDFIEFAFQFAHEAAPNAKLYYNDYNLFKAKKGQAAVALAKRLRAKGIRIDGIGEQGHYGIEPPLQDLEATLKLVAANNLEFMITELDVSALKFPDQDKQGADISLNFALQDEYNPYKNGLSDTTQARLAKAYTSLFKLFVKYHENIERVTLWGVSDADSWRNNWPMKGRTDYPLMFDRNHRAKPFVADIMAHATAQH